MTIKEQTLLGFELRASAQIAKQILQFIISAPPAPLLTPKHCGLIGVIIVLTRFTGLIIVMSFAGIDRSQTRDSFVLHVQG
ncbi:MAG: hypothetical protein ACW963_07180 [Candidatus Sifarchaeia archaeon]|jgi:hypothetical protein